MHYDLHYLILNEYLLIIKLNIFNMTFFLRSILECAYIENLQVEVYSSRIKVCMLKSLVLNSNYNECFLSYKKS
jgi:hypothetical protein